jgi:hypothetical protein
MARAMKALSMGLGSVIRHCVIVKGVLTPATRASARKPVVMDSFAAAVEKVSISGAEKYAKFFWLSRLADVQKLKNAERHDRLGHARAGFSFA